MGNDNDVAIIGAGLSGLCCALRLHQEGIPFTIYEAGDHVGGRVSTDLLRGFLLDRGFQIFLTAYPEAQAILDYKALDFKPFYPGSLVRHDGKFRKLTDPFRRPLDAMETLLSPVGTFSDKLKIASLRNAHSANQAVLEKPLTVMESLHSRGFSESMISEFFRPFLSGIFLESELQTSSTMFEFVFQMLARGDNVLPSKGMQSIPEQIAGKLPQGRIKFGCLIEKIEGSSIIVSTGDKVSARSVVLATEEPQARRLLGQPARSNFRSQTCLYFAAEKSPLDEPILVLNGDADRIINNVCVPSDVSPSYAPSGKALISASLVGNVDLNEADLTQAVRKQLFDWFGSQVNGWEHLRTYRIKYALPDQSPEALKSVDRTYDRIKSCVYTCGDYKETGSINGAMASGRKAAEAIIKDIGKYK